MALKTEKTTYAEVNDMLIPRRFVAKWKSVFSQQVNQGRWIHLNMKLQSEILHSKPAVLAIRQSIELQTSKHNDFPTWELLEKISQLKFPCEGGKQKTEKAKMSRSGVQCQIQAIPFLFLFFFLFLI